ncbi:MAG: DEAD/DEAH box helicase [Chitinophagales bacterium]|nr:DEAD/DEAH box helicase [Chitinophagales bacterium]
MGFKEINKENYNTNKAIISTQVKSGIDWFDIETNISFGDQKINLKDVQKAILNKTRYVQLGDGTKGILPKEWIEKFRKYFRVGEVKDNSVRTHKSNFTLIDTLFNEEVIDNDAKIEIMHLKEKLNNFQSIENIKIPKKLKATLRDYQKEGLNWLSFLNDFNFGGILADDMGLGKTIQIIAYFLAGYQKGKTNLVVVPTSLLFNWQKELEKFAPHINYLVLYGSNRNIDNNELKKHDLILTTYGTLISDIEELKKFHFNIIVLDESQAIKNPNSQRYKSVRLLKANQRIAATGTPVENSTFDLYAQLSFVMPGLLGSMKKFKEDYATPIDKFQDEIIAKELQQKVHPFILRRTKKQVVKELPDKTEMIITCEMGAQQRKVYDLYKAEFQKYLLGISEEELHKSSLHVLQGLTKLRQICNSPALLSDQEYYGNQSSKIEELMQQIDKLKNEHKVLVFSQFVGMLDLIKEKLEQENIKYAYLTGKTRNREEQVNLFQENDEVRVFLISLKAGGTGLNLTEAEYVFIIDPWWNPAVENQAIDRAYRIGQKNHVIAIRLIVPDSIEEKIMKLQEKKLKLVEDLIHTDKNSFKNLSKDDLLSIL